MGANSESQVFLVQRTIRRNMATVRAKCYILQYVIVLRRKRAGEAMLTQLRENCVTQQQIHLFSLARLQPSKLGAPNGTSD
jgi:hypothetical protein